MSSVQVSHYLRRAADFGNAMKLLSDDPDYLSSAALLAIHSAISYSDALRIGLGDSNLAHSDHRRAADILKSTLPSWFADTQGLQHLRKLLSRKSSLEYSEWMPSTTDLRDLVTAALRFEAWANQAGKLLKLEGWLNGDQ